MKSDEDEEPQAGMTFNLRERLMEWHEDGIPTSYHTDFVPGPRLLIMEASEEGDVCWSFPDWQVTELQLHRLSTLYH